MKDEQLRAALREGHRHEARMTIWPPYRENEPDCRTNSTRSTRERRRPERLAALAALKADIEHELTQALEIACEPLDERDPPARVAATHRLIDSYVNLEPHLHRALRGGGPWRVKPHASSARAALTPRDRMWAAIRTLSPCGPSRRSRCSCCLAREPARRRREGRSHIDAVQSYLEGLRARAPFSAALPRGASQDCGLRERARSSELRSCATSASTRRASRGTESPSPRARATRRCGRR
jgi:hypothetical protein